MRQLLADKISGNQVGLWLLLPEHLRLGTWDLLGAWTGAAPGTVEPRLALQLVHEAALCTCSLRQGRSLSQKGFEVANGLPFVASDPETYYNAPNVEHLRPHYEHLPAKLAAEGVNPRIPWLYNYQLDFRFA